MPNQTELEEMVVRLTGDAAEYQKMLRDAVDKTKEAASKVEEAAHRIEHSGESVKKFGESVIGAFEAYEIGGFLKEAKHEFQVMEQSTIKLNAVLKSNGRDVKQTREEYEEFAEMIRKSTTYGEREVLNLLKQAETFKLTGEKAKEAVKNAISLAAVNDGSADSFIRFTAAIAKGDTETAMMFRRMIPQLRGVKNETEFAAEAAKLFGTGWATAGDLAKSGMGKADQFAKLQEKAMEDLGKIVSEFPNPYKRAKKAALEWFMSVGEESKRAAVATGLGLTGLLAIGPTLMLLKPVVTILGSSFGLLGSAMSAVNSLRSIETWQNMALSLQSVTNQSKAATVATLAFRAALAGVILYGLYRLGEAANSARNDVKELMAQFEKSKELADTLEKLTKQDTSTKVQKAEGNPQFAADELEQARKNVDGLKESVKAAQEEINRGWGMFRGLREVFWGDPQFQQAKNELEAQQKQLALMRDRVQQLTEAQAKANKDQGSPKWVKNMSEVIAKNKELWEATNTLKDSLQIQADTMEMSADEAEIYKLKLKGLNDEQESQLRRLAELKEARQKEKDFNEKMQHTIEELRTPLEKYKDKVTELQEQLARGLPQAVFTAGMKKAKEELEEAQKKADKASSAIGKFDAALSGSAEAASRVAAWRDMLNEPNANGVTGIRGGGAKKAVPVNIEPDSGASARGGGDWFSQGKKNEAGFKELAKILTEIKNGIDRSNSKPDIGLADADIGDE